MRKRDNLGDPGLDGRIILRWIFRKLDEGYGLNGSDSGQGQMVGTCNDVMNLWVP